MREQLLSMDHLFIILLTYSLTLINCCEWPSELKPVNKQVILSGIFPCDNIHEYSLVWLFISDCRSSQIFMIPIRGVSKKINGRATVGRVAGGATGRGRSCAFGRSRQSSVCIVKRSASIFHGRPLATRPKARSRTVGAIWLGASLEPAGSTYVKSFVYFNYNA